jgi:hypothetical protein
MAIAILATIFIFPETMNHLCMSMISAQLAKANALILLQDEVLTSDLEGLAPGSPLIAKVNAVRATIIGEQQQREFDLHISFRQISHCSPLCSDGNVGEHQS